MEIFITYVWSEGKTRPEITCDQLVCKYYQNTECQKKKIKLIIGTEVRCLSIKRQYISKGRQTKNE